MIARRCAPGLIVVTVLICLLVAQGLWGSSDAAGQAKSSLVEISEINANTGMGQRDAVFEWVELHNTSADSVTLEGWSIADNQSSDPLGTITLPGDGYALVVASEEGRRAALQGATSTAAIVVIDDGRIGNGLANAGDHILLRDADGIAVDGASWGTDASVANSPAASADETLSRVAGERAFRVTNPTPGRPPELLATRGDDPPALRITEIFANAGRGQADASMEWIEIFNPLAEDVSLRRWRIADNAGSDLIPEVVFRAGQRLVIAATTNATEGELDRVIVEDGRIGNGLANGGDEVSLLDPGSRVVDRIIYGVGAIPLPEPGQSIAKIGAKWVVNTVPSPGHDAVTPLLATLIEDREAGQSSVPVRERSGNEATIPAWALVTIFAGVSIGTLTVHELWRRRHLMSWPRSPWR